jgi:type I restriction enzyme M protein
VADQSTQLVQKLWNYCNILRDDGLSYLLARGLAALAAQAGAQASGDYLFLKMADGGIRELGKRSRREQNGQ